MKNQIYKSGNLLYTFVSQFRVSLIYVIGVIVLCFFVLCSFSSLHNLDSSSMNSDVKLDLYCPSPPLFTQTIDKTGEVSTKNESTSNQIDNDWYSGVKKNIMKEEYNITYSEELGAYQSPNRANNIRFIYHKDGFTALPREARGETKDGWSLQLRITNYELLMNNNSNNSTNSINSTTQPLNYSTNLMHSDLNVDKNKASIENENIRIDYTNTEDGMRQDFTIKKKPEGNGKLRLNLSADTKLKMIIGADALMFKDNNGKDVMKYSALKVFDANGKVLRAFFEKNNSDLNGFPPKARGNDKEEKIKNLKSFAIVVNDEDAVYPITIDPLSSSPAWTADGSQPNCGFGFDVAAAGDVNGDGYGDVIVSAPYFDYYGKVYAYYGSATGLYFSGWSLSGVGYGIGKSVSTAGDMNGDGYSDVIIGYFYTINSDNKVEIYLGSPSGLTNLPSTYSYIGFVGSTAGDVNGDGYSDLIVGNPIKTNNSIPNEGLVYVYHGTSNGIFHAAPDKTLDINVSNARFGSSVCTAGDVNRDGYSDIIVGAPNIGKAYVYLGGASGLASSPIWSATNSADFGVSVSTAGDVNGDGYSDVIVGNSVANSANIYYGSASGLSATSNWNFPTAGGDVASAGDINGDGYGDVIIGSPLYDNGENDEGAAYMFLGSAAGLPSSPSWSAEGNNVTAHFGCSVATAGDVNGDGFSDVIIGAKDYNAVGKVFVYTGSASGVSLNADRANEGNQAEANMGFSVSSGDVNGDGYSDVIVGAPYFDVPPYTDCGRVFVFHGSANGLSSLPSWQQHIAQSNAQFGYCVSSVGDINNDGFSDVVIGGPGYSNGQLNEGVALLFNGSGSGLMQLPSFAIEENQTDAKMGSCVAAAGDINGDGFNDFLAGSSMFDNGQTDEGKMFLYLGSSNSIINSGWTAEGDLDNASFGRSAASAGDVNGDGYSDVIVGANTYGGTYGGGKVYLYYGSGSGLSASPVWTSTGLYSFESYGVSVSSAGDVNGDGFSDVIIGANGITGSVAFAHYGSSSGLSSSPDWTALGPHPWAGFGFSVSTAGDVNGDGYSDVIIGANTWNSAYIYHGSSTGLSATANWSSSPSSRFGWSVASAGDVNGDGYSDVVVGSIYYSNGESNEGRSYVYYGNGGASQLSLTLQFRPGLYELVSSGGLTMNNGNVQFHLAGRSSYGRADGKIVYEVKPNGTPFSGSIISNSTSSSGSGTNTELNYWGTALWGYPSGLNTHKVYKWRARVQYSPVNNPYQKLGPWRYYNNYCPVPVGNFRAWNGVATVQRLNLTMFIQGFYNPVSDLMIADTVKVYLRNSTSPYNKIDSAKQKVNTSGSASFNFNYADNGTPYYLQLSHRNSVETWSSNAVSFVNDLLSFNFTASLSQAFGNNMLQVDLSPVRFAIYNGDVNQDGLIDISDSQLIDNDVYNFVSGYVLTDLTGDGFLDINDAAIAENNAGNFVNVVRP